MTPSFATTQTNPRSDCLTYKVGYESHDRAAPEGAAAPKIAAPEIYFSLLEAQRGIIPFFFSLYQLQIVLLTIANKKILVFSKL